MTKEKTRNKIINAALIEFTEKGYENASTNCIVERAGVAKGMLFYYFKNKKDLYLYLINQSIKRTEQMYMDKLFEGSNDFLDRCSELSSIKLKAYTNNPLMFNFFGNAFLNDIDVPELKDIMTQVNELNKSMHQKFFNDLDTSHLRNDIPSEMLLEMIRWTLEGYESKLISKLQGEKITEFDLEPLWDEFNEFIDTLRTIFYK